MANWFVSQKVASSGVGTSLATAFKTIAEAISAAASSGDTIYVYEGVYNEGNFTITKTLNILGIGYVECNGGLAITKCFYFTGGVQIIQNINFKNYLVEDILIYKAGTLATTLKNCVFYEKVTYTNNGAEIRYVLENNIFIAGFDSLWVNPQGGSQKVVNNLFLGDTWIFTGTTGNEFKGNIFSNITLFLYAKLISSSAIQKTVLVYNNFYNCDIAFLTGKTATRCDSVEDLVAKFISDTSESTSSNQFTSSLFFNIIYNNSHKSNYTLDYDIVNNPIAFAGFYGSAIGPFQAAANIICKETSSSGNCDIYDISADAYSLGLFSGITNVGAIDNVNEKLYRTSDGANNWGVFVASTDLPRSHIIKNLQMFGTIIDRNGGQVSETPGDFAYNYQIDVLVKWSATLSKAALLADTTIPFVRFRFRPNEFNYYVDNSGTLVGDGESTYAGLVNSSDGGSGSLPPQKIVGKSFVAIIILQDA